MKSEIQLLQFLICEEFSQERQDGYLARAIQSYIYAARFPFTLDKLFIVTCWRKDERFHKEVIEYATDDGTSVRTPHMDIEPARDNVIFRWHTHRFPGDFEIQKPTTLAVRVILEWEVKFESYVLIEQRP